MLFPDCFLEISFPSWFLPSAAQLTETLQEALVPLISTRRCNSSCMYKGELTATMLCAGYPQGKIDACQVTGGSNWCCGVCAARVEMSRSVTSLLCSSPCCLAGGQRGPPGLPGRTHVALGRCSELGPGLCRAQPPRGLHQRGSASAVDLSHHRGKLGQVKACVQPDPQPGTWHRKIQVLASCF